MPRDIMLDESGDLLIKNGDFVVGESTNQHKAHLLLAMKGEYRQYADVGVGIGNYINDDALEDMPAAIQREWEDDGMTVTRLKVYADGKIDEEAAYD